jgi:hypothetical protein
MFSFPHILFIYLVSFILIYLIFSIGRRKIRKYFLMEPRPPSDALWGVVEMKQKIENGDV